MASRFVRKVRTASGAVAVQVVSKTGGVVVGVEHVGSAHTDADLALLLRAARERLLPGQAELDLGPVPEALPSVDEVADWTRPASGRFDLEEDESPRVRTGRPVSVAGGGKVVSTASLTLWGVLTAAYERLGFEVLGDEAFKSLVLARVVEPTSKADTARVLADIGVPAPVAAPTWVRPRQARPRHAPASRW